MINVSCSKLEFVRQNPIAFAQQMAANKNSGGGNFGMFQCWQSKAKALHTYEMDLQTAIKSLQQRFMKYDENLNNKRKQEFLLDRLSPYWEEIKSKDFKYLSSQKRISWPILKNVSLTGNTPMTLSHSNGFIAYFYTENPISWQQELRFPLLQYYLAKNICNCSFDDLKIGVYCLKNLSFDLKLFTQTEIENSILEAEQIFKLVNENYK
ncbi:hypothetical protein NAF17_16870 [Mucilaginibacter sp. RB4R14]|uniref:hypothetical protein n=1 Tax=Mucilaginibacter aurantiaciroseus TaxID=2949308 RepID=UPI002090DA5F|nr:hypothetical protein [Mucilaginibacter aurantiaciroseus]MCO5937221.1 hypothetical protein [Mucilaginibacter aurantiaciroseus]